ncbi:MAG: flagellar hook-basal body complex protein FliE [Lachnospiraceae bacterium]|jgi:flagellar hook-basal body complex protein FliE|nr:flagellar hook-basal body complex protein FliE [Lachnospiraceae bacterium]
MDFETVQFITPIAPWERIGNDTKSGEAAGNSEASLFSDIFHNVVNQVYTAHQDAENKQYLLSTGQLDDVHSLPIAEAKASLSVDILISLRNKALESYNELMKLNL